MLNPVFRLNKSLTARDLCKSSVLTFIVFEFKMSLPAAYYMEFTFVYCRNQAEHYRHTFCVACNVINYDASIFVNLYHIYSGVPCEGAFKHGNIRLVIRNSFTNYNFLIF
jgi:hypothetical protein